MPLGALTAQDVRATALRQQQETPLMDRGVGHILPPPGLCRAASRDAFDASAMLAAEPAYITVPRGGCFDDSLVNVKLQKECEYSLKALDKAVDSLMRNLNGKTNVGSLPPGHVEGGALGKDALRQLRAQLEQQQAESAYKITRMLQDAATAAALVAASSPQNLAEEINFSDTTTSVADVASHCSLGLPWAPSKVDPLRQRQQASPHVAKPVAERSNGTRQVLAKPAVASRCTQINLETGRPQPKLGTASANGQAQAPVGTLRTHLHTLRDVGESRILTVRKINRLAFAADSFLSSHFSQFGCVEYVLIAYNRASSRLHDTRQVRLRQAGLGFVVMRTADDAQAVLRAGPVHEVRGVSIGVFQFERLPIADKEEEDKDIEHGGLRSCSGAQFSPH